MKLKEWFEESPLNIQAIYDAKNGRRYIYTRDANLTNFAKNLHIEQVVELEDKIHFGAWLD